MCIYILYIYITLTTICLHSSVLSPLQRHKELREYDEADDIRVYMSMDYGVEVNDDEGKWWLTK